MRVREIMTKNPETLSPQTTLQTVAREMQKLDCGFMPISDKGKILGVVTDRDITLRAVAYGKDPTKTTVQEVMSKDHCCFVFENDDVEKAADKMCREKIRRLLVLDNEKDRHIRGVLSLGDLATKWKDHRADASLIETISETRH